MNSKLLTAFLAFLMGLNTALLIVILIRIERQPVQQQFGAGIAMARPSAAAQMISLPSLEDEALALSGPQRNKIARIKERWAREEQARRMRAAERMGRMPEVLMGDDLTLEAVQPLMDQAQEDSRKRMETMMSLFREFQEVLTPEQQRLFRQMFRERHRMMNDRSRRTIGERPGRMTRMSGDRARRYRDERSQDEPRRPPY